MDERSPPRPARATPTPPDARAAEIEAIRRDFGRITLANQDRVLRICRGLVRNEQRAQELAQDTFVKAYERLDAFEGRSDIGAWICGIARFVALAAVREASESLTEDGIVDPADAGLSTLKELGREERDALVRAAMEASLDAFEQEVAHLRYVENLPREAIAQELGLRDAEEVRAHLARISRRLKAAVRERLGSLGHGTSFLRTRW